MSCSQVPGRNRHPRRLGATLATQIGYLHPIWPDGLPVLGWAHWGSPRGAGGGPRALLSDGALRGSSAQHGIVLIQEGCGLIHHWQLWLFCPALCADGAPIQGKLRAVLHPRGQQPILVLLPADLQEACRSQRAGPRREQGQGWGHACG